MASFNPDTVDLMNRSILDEIPTVLGKLSLTEAQQSISRIDHYANTVSSEISNFPTPTTSQDELVINQRGPRTIYIPSSDIDEITKQNLVTKLDGYNINKSPVILKSTTHKRLLIDSSDKDATRVSKFKKLCTSSTIELPQLYPVSNTMTLQQNVDVFRTKKKKDACYPAHKLKYLEIHFRYLRRNIRKALSKSRTKTSHSSIRQASRHILAFKRFIIDHGTFLAECNRWHDFMDYFIMASKYLRCNPNWGNLTYNITRAECLNSLLSLCNTALDKMKGMINTQTLEHYTREMNLLYDQLP